MASAHGKPLFCWHVSRYGESAFILGDVRVPEAELLPLPSAIKTAFDGADLLIGCSPTHADAERRSRELKFLLYPEGICVLNRLSPETKAELERYCHATGFSVEPNCRLKPAFLADVIACHELGLTDLSIHLGLCNYLAREARQIAKPMADLLGPDALKLMSEMDGVQQDRILLDCLRSREAMVDDSRLAFSAWQSGDLSVMQQAADRHFNRYAYVPELRATEVATISGMISRVEELLHTGNVSFVVVGAVYLLGHDGLLEGLRRGGARVEQLVENP